MPFQLSEHHLYFDGKKLGPRAALYVDSAEFMGLDKRYGVVRMVMPLRIDAVFIAGDAVVGCESKKVKDLIDSTRSRRLARQVRTLVENVDIPTVLVRGEFPDFNTVEFLDVMRNLVCLQRLGVTLLPLPLDSVTALEFLSEYKKVLMPESRTMLSAVRGDDKRKVDEKQSLLKSIKGVGSVLDGSLLATFGTPLQVLSATFDELVSAGCSKTVAKRIKELVNG